MRSHRSSMLSLVALAGLAAPIASGAVHQVIHTGIPGHPTAQVPGQPAGVSFRGPTIAFLDLYGSPSGNHWVIKAFTNEADAVNEVILTDSGPGSLVRAKEGAASPVAGRFYTFMDSDCAINDSGSVAFGNRLDAPTTNDEIIFKYDAVTDMFSVAAREGDPAPGLFDTGAIGDELFGNSLNSPNILNGGTVRFRADLIQNIATAFRSALYSGSTLLAQEGTTFSGGTYDSFVASSLSSDADGTNWIVEVDADPGSASLEAAVLNGTVVLKDGDPLLGSTVSDIFSVRLAGNGDWFVRGGVATGDDYIVRNGSVIVSTGAPITPGSSELWGSTVSGVTGNMLGDYLVIGNTNSADPLNDQVMVFNGLAVVAREGDTADLNGNGVADDDAFITSFGAEDIVLGNDGTIVFTAAIRNAAGTSLGNAILRRPVPTPACPGDFDGDGLVGLSDIAAVIDQWYFPGYGLNGIAQVVSNWGAACP